MRYYYDDWDDEGFKIRWLADCIRKDICEASQPRPEKVHYDYWVVYPYVFYPDKNEIHQHEHIYSYEDPYCRKIDFPTFEEARSHCEKRFRLKLGKLDRFPELSWFKEGDRVYEVIDKDNKYWSRNNQQIRELYLFHHAVYDAYADYVLELEEETIQFMKDAYRQLRIAEIYERCIDGVLKVEEDGLKKDDLLDKFKEDMQLLEKDLSEIDWTKPEFPEEEVENYDEQYD